MIFVVYYTKVGKSFFNDFIQHFPQTIDDIEERFPENVDNEIAYCFQSINHFHPKARLVILTDLNTPIRAMDNVEVQRYDVDPDQPAYMRLIAQQQFLKTLTEAQPVIFCDYDLLYQESIEPLFDQFFDLALVYRKYEGKELHDHPVNGGLIAIHPRGLDKARHFLDDVHTLFLNHYSIYKEWGGVQKAMNSLVGVSNIHQSFPHPFEVNGIKILPLPSQEYNFTVKADAHFIDYMPNKKILHFKGPRKAAMKFYWNSYLSPQP